MPPQPNAAQVVLSSCMVRSNKAKVPNALMSPATARTRTNTHKYAPIASVIPAPASQPTTSRARAHPHRSAHALTRCEEQEPHTVDAHSRRHRRASRAPSRPATQNHTPRPRSPLLPNEPPVLTVAGAGPTRCPIPSSETAHRALAQRERRALGEQPSVVWLSALWGTPLWKQRAPTQRERRR